MIANKIENINKYIYIIGKSNKNSRIKSTVMRGLKEDLNWKQKQSTNWRQIDWDWNQVFCLKNRKKNIRTQSKSSVGYHKSYQHTYMYQHTYINIHIWVPQKERHKEYLRNNDWKFLEFDEKHSLTHQNCPTNSY